jgi:hypothetical protein
MYYDFVPRRTDAEIRMTNGRASEIGEYVRSLEVEDIKELFRQGVDRIVEYNTTGYLVWVPASECYTYWKWAQPHIVRDDTSCLDDYPNGFFLAPYEWRGHDGERMIVFERVH